MARLPLTPFQAHALGVIRDCGPADGAEVARNLLVEPESARGVLARLERRGLVAAVYTGHRFRGRAYEITDDGETAYMAEFGEEETE